ncbi:putative membrane transport protein [Lupinus albus]|uniref:Putative membrane transport protein n=1 Tax=Lupinus albus TaxID=3870 RepID=A0A6A4NS79_LUPAL|nr:putative membrane transport protein [Lupinus albus]
MKLILITVWKKLLRNSIIYVTIIGTVWSLISFRFNFQRPLIIREMVELISQTAIGTTVFSLGLCMALQPKMVDLKIPTTLATIGARFLLAPTTMIAASMVVGLKGVTFEIAVIQVLKMLLKSYQLSNRLGY